MTDLLELANNIQTWTQTHLSQTVDNRSYDQLKEKIADLLDRLEACEETKDRHELLMKELPFLGGGSGNKLADGKDLHATFEHVMRNAIQEVTLLGGEGGGDDATGIRQSAASRLVEFTVYLSRLGLAHPSLAVQLISDLFEMQTLAECEATFELVESRVDIWKEELFFNLVKSILLRSCNDLLRRLSKSQNNLFCGRILVFLAKFFPLFERSGLNLISEINQENPIQIQDPEDVSSTPSASQTPGNSQPTAAAAAGATAGDVDMEQGEIVDDEDDEEILRMLTAGSSKTAGPISFTYDLYSKLWSLQEFFRSPLNCYDGISWKKFETCCSVVLKSFENYKLYENKDRHKDSSKKKSSSRTANKSVSLDENDQQMDTTSIRRAFSSIENSGSSSTTTYFAKYLTSQRLLELQMGDSNFRHYIYIQLLILFQYLSSSVKFRPDTKVLTEDQKKTIQSLTQQIYGLIENSTSDNGRKMSAIIKHFLEREECWSAWKNNSCPELKEVNEQGNVRGTYVKKRKLGEEFAAADALGQTLVGNQDLNRLWNLEPDNWAACKSPKRSFQPDLFKYMSKLGSKRIKLEKKKSAGGEITETDTKIAENYTWRALRLLASSSPHFFTPHNSATQKLDDYLYKVWDNTDKDRKSNIAAQLSATSTTTTAANHQESKTVESNAMRTSGGGSQAGNGPAASTDGSDSPQVMMATATSGLEETEDISDDELRNPSSGNNNEHKGSAEENSKRAEPAEEGEDEDEDESDDDDVMVADGGSRSHSPEPIESGDRIGKYEIEHMASRILTQWRDVGLALQFETDELDYFNDTSKSRDECAKRLLLVWKEQNEKKYEGRLYDQLQAFLDKAGLKIDFN